MANTFIDTGFIAAFEDTLKPKLSDCQDCEAAAQNKVAVGAVRQR